MELYNANEIPLSNDLQIRALQEKFLNKETLGIVIHGRDQSKIVKKIGDYECKPDHCYRAIPENVLEIYMQTGYIADLRTNTQEYEEQIDENGVLTNNNGGIDWYLGGAAPCGTYGFTIIECPADKNYFRLSFDNGSRMTLDPTVRHIKSSPKNNPIPISMITNVFDYKKILEEEKQDFSKETQELLDEADIILGSQQSQMSPQTQELINQAQEILSQTGQTEQKISQTMNNSGRAR